MTKIAKIQILTVSKDLELDKLDKRPYDILHHSARAANLVMSNCMELGGLFGEKLKEMSKDEVKDFNNYLYAVSANYFKNEGIEKVSNNAAYIASNVVKKYKQTYFDVKIGKATHATYKSFPVYVRKGALINKSLKENYTFFTYGITFKLHFGRDRSNNKSIVDNCIAGNYKICDSTFTKDKNGKLFLNLCYDPPKKECTIDKSKIVGVDLGIATPIVAKVYKGHEQLSLGDIMTMFRPKMAIEKQRRSTQKSLTLCKGGHGRKRKLAALERIKDKESNFRNTINHTLSKKLIEFCVKSGAGTIVMEDLSGFNSSEVLLRHWTYFDLQTKIEYKAKEYGIDFHKVNPRYTSRRCPKCGHIHADNRKTQAKFECVECGHTDNADKNACTNIAEKFIGIW